MPEVSLPVTVLMATHNDGPYVREAIDSILRQTYTDFEFLIIDDASTDDTPAILDSYHDSRIVRLRNESNLGLAASLNRGIAIARGEYIARMDGDDVSLPTRLERQLAYLESHPEIGILGTQYEQLDGQGNWIRRSTHPLTHGLIMWQYLSRLAYPLTHATVVMQRDLIVNAGGYDIEYPREQDGELFLRLIWCSKYANLPSVLYRTRSSRPRAAASDTLTIGYPLTLQIRAACMARLLGRDVEVDSLRPLIFPTSRRHRQRLCLDPSVAEAKTAVKLLLNVLDALRDGGHLTGVEYEEALAEVPDLIANVLRYCEPFAFEACDRISAADAAKYLVRRTVRGFCARLGSPRRRHPNRSDRS